MRCGIACVITELEQPLSVRRMVSFSSAVHTGSFTVEGITARLVHTTNEAAVTMATGEIPVLVDPDLSITLTMQPELIIDARMIKDGHSVNLTLFDKIIGMGPGFTAGINCRAVIETKRGPNLGRVIFSGSTEPDSGIPEQVKDYTNERVLRAPADGQMLTQRSIGELIHEGEEIAVIAGKVIKAQFTGIIRGLLLDGMYVRRGMKIGDIDPRCVPEIAFRISEKALAIGGGALEAVLNKDEERKCLLSR